MAISDEDLAKLLYVTQGEAVLLDDDGEDSPASWDDLPEHEPEDQGENLWLPAKDTFRQMARAVRAALCPPVTPLAPGETVTISTTPREGGMFVRAATGVRLEVWFTDSYGQPCSTRHPDAAGVRALIQAGRRWLAAQEDRQHDDQ